MIAKLTGILDHASSDFLIVDVNGVGYQVFTSRRTAGRIGSKGDPVSLFIDTHVREDAITLFGFADASEQEWFRVLTSVQGVGPKAGLSILSTVELDRLAFSIAAGDAAIVRQADGVGPKLATRIVTELKDKVAKMNLNPVPAAKPAKGGKAKEEAKPEASIEHDAVSALINLGYARTDAYQAVLMAREKANDNQSLNDIIRLALKELSSAK